MPDYVVNYITLSENGSEEVESFDRFTNSRESVLKLVESFFDDERAETLTMRVVKR